MAPHVPHLLLPGPWPEESLPLGSEHRSHLTRVLRVGDGARVTYTDGHGRMGDGVLTGGAVRRGDERDVRREHAPSMAVAPPKERERVRFLVEKLAELGVPELSWLSTEFGDGRIPSAARVDAWCRAGLEQSRGAWSMVVARSWVTIADLPPHTVFGDRSTPGRTDAGTPPCIAIGPPGGWADGEVPAGARTASFAAGVLRVETAAIAAVVHANGFSPFNKPL